MTAMVREYIKVEGKGSPSGYAIKLRVCSLVDTGGTGNDQPCGRATPLYPAGVQSQGLTRSCILHTGESHSRGKRDSRSVGLAGPIPAGMGPLQE